MKTWVWNRPVEPNMPHAVLVVEYGPGEFAWFFSHSGVRFSNQVPIVAGWKLMS